MNLYQLLLQSVVSHSPSEIILIIYYQWWKQLCYFCGSNYTLFSWFFDWQKIQKNIIDLNLTFYNNLKVCANDVIICYIIINYHCRYSLFIHLYLYTMIYNYITFLMFTYL